MKKCLQCLLSYVFVFAYSLGKAVHARLRLETSDQPLPLALRLEDELDELAHGTVSARIVRLQDGGLAHFLHGIADSCGEAHLPHDGQVDEVIAEVRNLLVRETQLRLEVFVGLALVEIALVDLGDVQLLSAVAEVLRLAPRDDGRLQARAVRERDAQAVAAEEGLEELAISSDVDAAVRQDTVDIEDDELDSFCALQR